MILVTLLGSSTWDQYTPARTPGQVFYDISSKTLVKNSSSFLNENLYSEL